MKSGEGQILGLWIRAIGFIAEMRLQFGITSIWFCVFLLPKNKRVSIPSTCFLGRMIRCLWTEHLEYVDKKCNAGLPWWLRRHRFDPWSGKILHAMGKQPVCHNYSLCSRAQELQLVSPRAATTEVCTPESLCSPAREACAPKLESSPHWLQLEKGLQTNADPAQLKHKQINKHKH